MAKLIKILTFVAFLTSTTATTNGNFCTNKNSEKNDPACYPFWDHTLSISDRLDDLMKRLTLQEMVDQMANGGGVPNEPAPPIERLGIPPYNFDTECLRGVAVLNSTAFPMPIGLAASFSPDLLYEVASAISTEVRAIYNNASKHGDYGNMKGLSCFAPFINLARHPLWGRMQEVFGEDPFLIGQLAKGYITGLQGNHPKYIKAIAGCKTVIAHSGPENIPSSRMTFDAKVNERDLRVTYLPHFKDCIDAGALNLMCSYNSLNGVPTCASESLLTHLIRNEFNFDGFIVSDMGAIENIHDGHKYAPNYLEAAVLAANAGVDLDLHGSANISYKLLVDAVEQGKVQYATIVNRTRKLFEARMKLGLFDPPSLNPYTEIDVESSIQTPYHRSLATEAAMKSFVLLKNINNRLPLMEGTINKLAILGPMSNNVDQIFGGYTPMVIREFTTTPYDSLKTMSSLTYLVEGCESNECKNYDQSNVIEAASAADVVIVCLGTGQDIEGEDKDRPDMNLPGHQMQLLRDAMLHAKSPIILLLFTGCPVDLVEFNNTSEVGAIMQCFFPAQSTGEALRRVLFVESGGGDGKAGGGGNVVSPSARLPYTWPLNLNQVPPMVNYSMVNRTYRYLTDRPLYPFGYGLSYTSFLYFDLSVYPLVVNGDDDDVINVEVSVKNVGNYDADEVVQVYISWRNLPKQIVMPNLQLVAVSRQVVMVTSDHASVKMQFKTERMKVFVDDVGFVYYPGYIDLYVGGQQPIDRRNLNSNILHSEIQIVI